MSGESPLIDFVLNQDSELDELSQKILTMERLWWKYAGAKEQAITRYLSMPATNYYQILNELIESDAAMEFDPMLVKRLRRLRSTKQRVRPGTTKTRRQ